MLALFSLLAIGASQAVFVTPATGFESAKEPQVAIDPSGRVYVAYGMGDAIYLSASKDKGATFSPPVKVAEPGKLSLGMRRGPRIAVCGKTIVVTAIAGQQGGGKDGDLQSWRSEDGGQTWSEPTVVNDVPGAAREGLHGMAASPTGDLACAWLDLRSKGTKIYLSTSADAGKSWTKNRLVYESPDGTVCQCCHPSLAYASDGTLAVMWRNVLKGDRDMYLARSKDGGATFGAAAKLGSGNWPLNACPMDGGNLAFRPDGSIMTAWRRNRTVYECAAGKQERELGEGEQPWVTVKSSGSIVYTVWLGRRGGPVYAYGIERAWGATTLAKTGDDPVVTSGADLVIAVWTVPGKGIQSALLDF